MTEQAYGSYCGHCKKIRTECICAQTGRKAVPASQEAIDRFHSSRFVKAHKAFKEKVWPYGFRSWLWQVGLRLREKGVFKSDESPNDCFAALDTEAWMVHFMNGLSPLQAAETDIKEGGEHA